MWSFFLPAIVEDILSFILCRTPNDAALALLDSVGFKHVFNVHRMHINGNPNEYKDTVYGLTSVCVCSFWWKDKKELCGELGQGFGISNFTIVWG